MRSRAIVFVGMDGAGKSTLSRALESDLLKDGLEVRHIWVLENEQSLLRRLLRTGSSLGSPVSLQSHQIPGTLTAPSGYLLSFSRKIYPAVVVLDYLVYGLLHLQLPFLWGRNKVWIFDRYFFDIILSLSEEFNLGDAQTALIWSFLGGTFPDPDIIFFIDVEPEVAVSRKRDAYPTMDAAVQMQQRYLGLLETLQNRYGKRVLRIDNNCGITESVEGIRKRILPPSG
jgi:thymidylate kinase